MTTDAVLQFRQAVNSSAALKDEIRGLSGHTRADFVAMGARHGYEFSEDDLASVANSVRDELTDFELELVSGGVDVLQTEFVRRNAATYVMPKPYDDSKDKSIC